MPKPNLMPPWDKLESDIIDSLIAGHQQWRPDLDYPQSHSDMQGAVRGLLQMFEIKRRPLPFKLPILECKCGVVDLKLNGPEAVTKHIFEDCPQLQYIKRKMQGFGD